MSNNQIGSYLLGAELGRGSLARVFVANEPGGAQVALKLFVPDLNADPIFRAALLRTGPNWILSRHPHLIRVDAVGEVGDRLYMAMAYASGGSLRTMISHGKQSGLGLIGQLDLLRQAALGLSDLHRRGIIHGDLGANNLLLQPAANGGLGVLLADHQLALLVTHDNDVVTGGLAYIAPERFLHGVIEPHSDLYALGVVLYELLAGEVPFWATTRTEAARRHVHEPPPSIRFRYHELPASVEALLLRCLAKEPALRPPNANVLATELAQIIDSLRPSQPQLVLLPPPPSPLAVLAPNLPIVVLLDASGRELSRYSLSGTGLTVGRDPSCTIVLPINDTTISRQHLRVGWDGTVVTVTDLQSANGTLLGVRPIPSHRKQLWPYDEELTITPYRLRLELPAAPSVQPVPVPNATEVPRQGCSRWLAWLGLAAIGLLILLIMALA